jgi:prevent-host-death family protein
MKSVGAYEAKTHLPQLLKRVAKGERITITKHGVPMAVLQPPQNMKSGDVKTVIEQLRAFRKKRRPGDMTIREMIEEGRR